MCLFIHLFVYSYVYVCIIYAFTYLIAYLWFDILNITYKVHAQTDQKV